MIYWIYSDLVWALESFEIGIFVTGVNGKQNPRYRGQAVNRLMPDTDIMEVPYTDLQPGGILCAIGYWCGIIANRFDRRSMLNTNTDTVIGSLRVGSW